MYTSDIEAQFRYFKTNYYRAALDKTVPWVPLQMNADMIVAEEAFVLHHHHHDSRKAEEMRHWLGLRNLTLQALFKLHAIQLYMAHLKSNASQLELLFMENRPILVLDMDTQFFHQDSLEVLVDW